MFLWLLLARVFLERGKPKIKTMNFQMKLHQKDNRTVRKDQSVTNIFQNRSVYKSTAVKLLKFKLCISMPAIIRQEIQKVHFKNPSFCFSHPCLSYSLTKRTNHEII